MPGVIMIPHGAGARFDRETGMDLSGAGQRPHRLQQIHHTLSEQLEQQPLPI